MAAVVDPLPLGSLRSLREPTPALFLISYRRRRSAAPRWTLSPSWRQLAHDLTELGDTATSALVRQAIDRFSAWKFEAGEELLARALEERRNLVSVLSLAVD